jgi:serine transporter
MNSQNPYLKMTSQDWGWVAVNIGMGIGAGIVFLPIQAGIVGLWTFLLAVLVAYPALYQFQRLFINTLVESRRATDYPATISEYLGSKWGAGLGFVYFAMLLIWFFVYSETITNDSASYIQTAGLTDGLLSANPFYGLVIVLVLVLVAFASRTLLLNLSKLLVIVVLTSLTLLALMLIPFWTLDHVQEIVSVRKLITQTIVTLPFAVTSILFLQSLSPLVIYARSEFDDIDIARRKAHQIMNWSFMILASVIFFFAFSCTISISPEQAYQAFVDNTSFLAVMAKTIPGVLVPSMGVIIDLCAIVTSFFAVLIGLHEACVGLYMNLVAGDGPREKVNKTKLSIGVVAFIVLLGWFATVVDFPILYFTSISSPIFAVIGCFIPVILIYKVNQFARYRGSQAWIAVGTGALLVLSPFLAIISQ